MTYFRNESYRRSDDIHRYEIQVCVQIFVFVIKIMREPTVTKILRRAAVVYWNEFRISWIKIIWNCPINGMFECIDETESENERTT